MSGAWLLGLLLALGLPAVAGAGDDLPLDGLVVVGEKAAAALGDRAGVRTIPARALPERLRHYTAVEAIVIGGDALSRLDEARLRALLEYAGLCGRLILVDTPGDAGYVLGRRAGCGGRFVTTAHATIAPAVLDRVLELPRRPMVKAAALRELLPDANGELRLMSLFAGGFLTVFLALQVSPVLRPAALGFCLLATAVAGLLWSGGRNEAFVAWAEAEDDERIARYVSLHTVTSAGRSNQQLSLAEFGTLPLRITGTSYTLEEDSGYVDWSATLLAKLSMEGAGSFPIEPTLRGELRDGLPTVCNRASRTSSDGWLAAAGRIYALPPLAPGETWQPDGGSAVSGSPSLALLEERADGVALLQKLTVPGGNGAREAWVLRRETRQTETTPCSE